MAREIEYKFLVANDDWRRQAGPGVPYRQGYLSLDPERSVRVRVAGEHAFLTIKGKSEGAGRDEFEYMIPKDDAEQMLESLCLKPLIQKKRYVVQRGSVKWEIDVFEGANRGLIVAEVETRTEEHDFEKPEWLGEEVTGDSRYFNISLVQHPYTEWEQRKK